MTLSLRICTTLLASALLCCGTARACPGDDEARAVSQAVLTGKKLALPPATPSVDDAACGRDKVVRQLEAALGRTVGYKAGLTNEAVQKVFNVNAPMRGDLLAGMMVREGTPVPVGAAPGLLFEADLIAEVGDASINAATTPLEALRAIKAFHTFIELPWTPFDAPLPKLGANLLFANVAAYRGVVGKTFSVEATAAGVDSLARMSVTLFDGTGKQLDTTRGEALMGNPLNVVIWLAADLRKAGKSLKAGDLLSLGSFSRLHPAVAGGGARVRYEGVPGNPEVAASFAQ